LTRLIDLSMPVHADMVTFNRVPAPALLMYESWSEFADRIGATEQGVDSLTATYMIVTNDHVGTHCDAVRHIVPGGGGPETIPLENCYGDGVVLDLRSKPNGHGITAADIDEALKAIDYTLKERDIVLIHTGASAYNDEERYLADHVGMTREATLHLIAQGVRMMGIDAITFDPPVWAMFERKQFWEAHRVMNDEPYWHLENLCNLDQIGRSHGFKLALFPVKWVGTTAAPVRAVAIVDDAKDQGC
jgi:kynurenine formamidase